MDTSLLVCKPVVELSADIAKSIGCIEIKCEECTQLVWVTPRNLVLKKERNTKVVCNDCAAKLIEGELSKGEKVFVLPAQPTVDEIERRNYERN